MSLDGACCCESYVLTYVWQDQQVAVHGLHGLIPVSTTRIAACSRLVRFCWVVLHAACLLGTALARFHTVPHIALHGAGIVVTCINAVCLHPLAFLAGWAARCSSALRFRGTSARSWPACATTPRCPTSSWNGASSSESTRVTCVTYLLPPLYVRLANVSSWLHGRMSSGGI